MSDCSTHAFDVPLKPCPFCGGEAHVVSDYSSERDETRWNLWHGCNGHEGEGIGYGYSLHPWFETPWYKTEAEAIAAWNSRAERTCKQEERGWGTEGDHARVWLTCGHDCMVPTVQDLPNYCPNCGAKVVGE